MKRFFSQLRKKMSSQILAILISIALLFSVVTFFILQTTIRPSYDALEEKALATNIQRIQEGFAREQEYLQQQIADWANWNDAWEFCKTPDNHFVSSNLNPNAMMQFSLTGVSFIAILDTQNRLLVSTLLKYSTLDSIHLSHPTLQFIQKEILGDLSPSIPFSVSQGIQTGLFDTDSGTFIFSISPVLKGDGTGPATGCIIMGKAITPEAIQAMALQTQVTFELLPYTKRTSYPEAELLATLSDQTPYLVSRKKRVFHGYALLYDFAGAPLYIIKTTHTPTIVQQGEQTIRTALLLVLASFIITISTIFFLLHRYLISPLRLLSKEVHSLADAQEIEGKIHMHREDEIGILAQSFNYLLQHLYRQSEKLRKASLYDELTKTYNRPRILELWEAEQQRLKRYKHPFSLMIVGIDNIEEFRELSLDLQKEIKKVALLLKKNFRSCDLIGRIGEQQFLLLLPFTGAVGAMRSAERARHLQTKMTPEGSQPSVTFSIGICAITEDNYTFALSIAEANLKRAQEMGGNSIISSNG